MPDMTPDANDLPISPVEAKREWHAPTLEEVDYATTEAFGGPGALFDGVAPYSTP